MVYERLQFFEHIKFPVVKTVFVQAKITKDKPRYFFI